MKCKECGLEMTVDHVVNGKVVFVCTNKNCSRYLKAELDGEPIDNYMKPTEKEAREFNEK